MQNFKEFLDEGVNDNYLYHATHFLNLKRILRDNKIIGRTTHDVGKFHSNENEKPIKIRKQQPYSYNYQGVSLTRNYDFAKKWRREEVIIVLDKLKLKQNYRIRSIHYWNRPKDFDNFEYEDFLIGDIEPLRKYLVRIDVKYVEEAQLEYPHYAEYFEKMK